MPDEVTILPGAYVADGVVMWPGVVVGPNAVVLAATEPWRPAHDRAQRCGHRSERHGPARGGDRPAGEDRPRLGRDAVRPASRHRRRQPGAHRRLRGQRPTRAPTVPSPSPPAPACATSRVRGVSVREFTTVIDIRGSLTAAEVESRHPIPAGPVLPRLRRTLHRDPRRACPPTLPAAAGSRQGPAGRGRRRWRGPPGVPPGFAVTGAAPARHDLGDPVQVLGRRGPARPRQRPV